MLLCQIKKRFNGKLSYRKKTLNYLIILITSIVCMLDALATHVAFGTKLRLPMVLCALLKLNYF